MHSCCVHPSFNLSSLRISMFSDRKDIAHNFVGGFHYYFSSSSSPQPNYCTSSSHRATQLANHLNCPRCFLPSSVRVLKTSFHLLHRTFLVSLKFGRQVTSRLHHRGPEVGVRLLHTEIQILSLGLQIGKVFPDVWLLSRTRSVSLYI